MLNKINISAGKISRSLAAKASISARVDALGEGEDNSVGLLNRQKLEARVRECEKRQLKKVSGTGKGHRETGKFEFKKEQKYNTGEDFMFEDESKYQAPGDKTTPAGKKRKLEIAGDPETTPGEEGGKKKKKKKKSLGPTTPEN